MAVTWKVVALDSTKTVGSLSDVVTNAHWVAYDNETVDGKSHDGSRFGYVPLADPDSGSFIAYKDITSENAIAWVKNALGSDEVTAIETSIADQITESKAPTRSSGVPW